MREAGVQRHSCCAGIMVWRPTLLSQESRHWSLTDRIGSAHWGMCWFIGQMGSGKPNLRCLASALVGGKTLVRQDPRRSEIYPGGSTDKLTESRQGYGPLSPFLHSSPVTQDTREYHQSTTEVTTRRFMWITVQACRCEYGQKRPSPVRCCLSYFPHCCD